MAEFSKHRKYFLSKRKSDCFRGVTRGRGILLDEANDNIDRIKGYSAIQKDHNTSGEGILLYLSDDLSAKILYKSNNMEKGKSM